MIRLSIISAVAIASVCSADKIEQSVIVASNNTLEEQDVAIPLDHIESDIILKNNLSDAGCGVSIDNGARLIFISRAEDAHFLLDGNLKTLFPRRHTATLPYGVSTNYDGPAYSAEIMINYDSERPIGPETSDYGGRLIIRDAEKRIVLNYSGKVRCGA